jgi:uncharacterized protein
LILSLYNIHARGIQTPNVVVGMALFCGGLAQFLAGMWEFATGNTFGATGKHWIYTFYLYAKCDICVTAFSSYGAFWLSFAALLIPSSGVNAAYKASLNPAEELDAIAIYLTSWMIVTFLFLYVCSSCPVSLVAAVLIRLLVPLSLASIRKSVGLTALFFFLTATFLILAVCEYMRTWLAEPGWYMSL